MRYLNFLALVCGLAFTNAFAAEAIEERALVTALWQADAESVNSAKEVLLQAVPNTARLYQLLRSGPEYSAQVPVGEQVVTRRAADGTEYPYMVFIPQDYDPQQKQAVEFILHGGVNRPKPGAGENFWERSMERVGLRDRITVIPVAWPDHFWWKDNQADNLRAILKDLKRVYNIDENRVTLSGISDGGTGAYFYAFKQPTEWAAFLPYIGHPGVLRNPQSGGGYRLYFENLRGKPLFIVNGENDRLYPAASLSSFMEILGQEGVVHTWRVIAEGGHNTDWMPEEREAIEQFRQANPRDPLPDSIEWVADRTDRYHRNHWIKIDELAEENTPSLLKVDRMGNRFEVDARGVTEFTLLLNPEEVDFAEPIIVNINGRESFNAQLEQDSETLLEWLSSDLDRTMLFTAELPLTVN